MFARNPGPNTILTVHGDSAARKVIGRTLAREGHAVIEAADGQTAVKLARVHRPDIIILDTALPDMNSLELCAYLRTLPYVTHTPILFVSDRSGALYAAQALDSGGDDYLRLPFSSRELKARVRALLRRAERKGRQTALPVLQLDASTRSVQIDDRRVQLTVTEYQLLEYLCQAPLRHHSAHDLLQALWGHPSKSGDTALVRNHIRNLRRKIESDPQHPRLLVSLHGRGYLINAVAEGAR
ncbi:MAG: response regulator transcription factor [Anaerolineae bacterium]|nr:response regulator transcription factor [Anaerolineae bacterium]